MTTGIYILKFIGTDRVYVGQSKNIERRFISHKNILKQGTGAKKLQEAYNRYGAPSMEILLECDPSELDSLEKEAIEIYDSVPNGFNTDTGGYSRPELSGENAPSATITNEQAVDILKFLVNTEYRYTQAEIADFLEVSRNVVKDISAGISHSWLEKEFPEEYITLRYLKFKHNNGENNKTSIFTNAEVEEAFWLLISNPTECITSLQPKTRLSYSSLKSLANGVNYKWLSDKYPNEYATLMSLKGNRDKTSGKSALAQGKLYPPILSPEGVTYSVTNIKAFAREHGLNDSHLGRVLRGQATQHKGWVLQK